MADKRLWQEGDPAAAHATQEPVAAVLQRPVLLLLLLPFVCWRLTPMLWAAVLMPIPYCNCPAGQHVCGSDPYGQRSGLVGHRSRPGGVCVLLGLFPHTGSSRIHLHQVRSHVAPGLLHTHGASACAACHVQPAAGMEHWSPGDSSRHWDCGVCMLAFLWACWRV